MFTELPRARKGFPEALTSGQSQPALEPRHRRPAGYTGQEARVSGGEPYNAALRTHGGRRNGMEQERVLMAGARPYRMEEDRPNRKPAPVTV